MNANYVARVPGTNNAQQNQNDDDDQKTTDGKGNESITLS